MNLTALGLIISGLSALGGFSAVFLLRGRMKLDKMTLDSMDRERREKDEQRDRERRLADEERDRLRRKEDDDRVASLRMELGQLSTLANDRFNQWRDAIDDIDEMWEYIEAHQPWDREAYRKLNEASISISKPPELAPRRSRQRTNGGAGDAADDRPDGGAADGNASSV